MAALETTVETSLESGLATLFARERASLAGPLWLAPLRAEALSRVLREGLPHRRVEAWKFTDLRNKLVPDLDIAKGNGATPPSLFAGMRAHHVGINGGRLTNAPNTDGLPDGLEILSLAEALATPSLWLRQWLQPTADPLENLNLAFVADGAMIRVGEGVRVALPLLLRVTQGEGGAMAHTRSVVSLEAGAELTLIELDDGNPETQGFANTAMSIVLEPGARLTHLRLTASAKPAIVVRNDDIELARDASYDGAIFSSGAALARQQMRVRLNGAGASFNVACAYAASSNEHNDYALEIVHEAPHTTSRVLAKGVAAGSGHGVVQGRVVVQPAAQKSDSHQLSRALLLSAHAEIDQKPELEIYADDVKCGHGAAVGALDEDQLFYLRTRGISEPDARSMLVAAFLGEITDRVANEAWRERVAAWLAERMARVTGEGA